MPPPPPTLPSPVWQAPCECLGTQQLSLAGVGVGAPGMSDPEPLMSGPPGEDAAGDSREWGPCATVVRPRASMNTALSAPTPRGDHGTGLGDQRASEQELHAFLAFWPQLTLKWVLNFNLPSHVPGTWKPGGQRACR